MKAASSRAGAHSGFAFPQFGTTIPTKQEETGLDVEITRLAGIYNKPEKSELVFSFVCKIIGGQLTLNEEADKIEYFAIKDIPHNTSPKQVDRIHDVLEKKEIVSRIWLNTRQEFLVEIENQP